MGAMPIANDAYTQFLHRLAPSSVTIWLEVIAKSRGFHPECVLFDNYCSSLLNLKKIDANGWHWLTRLKHNRWVNPDRCGNRSVNACEISGSKTVLHFENYGMLKAFRIMPKDGTAEHWATNHLKITDLQRLKFAEASWNIEANYQCGGLPMSESECSATPYLG